MFSYCDLEGIEGGRAEGLMAGSAAQMVRQLGWDCRVTSAANDNGAITAWLGDDGKYRAAFSRYCVSRPIQQFTSKKALRAFLEEAWPEMSF